MADFDRDYAFALTPVNGGAPGGSGVAPRLDDVGQILDAPGYNSDGDGDQALPMGDNAGSPGGGVTPAMNGLEPISQNDGSPGAGLAPMGDSSSPGGSGIAPMGESNGSPGGAGFAPAYDDAGDSVANRSPGGHE